MPENAERMAYVAIVPGMPGCGAASVDDGAFSAKEMARDIARWVRSGYRVERWTVEQAREGLGEFSKARKAQGQLFTET
jgi:hypothetical protein